MHRVAQNNTQGDPKCTLRRLTLITATSLSNAKTVVLFDKFANKVHNLVACTAF